MDDALLALGIFAAALLYSSVGHGGGSGYLAAMAFAGLAPAEMKPAALALNVLVAGIGTWRFARARAFVGALFWPFALTAVPFAALGGALELPSAAYRPLLGAVLLFAAARMAFTPAARFGQPNRNPPLMVALACGAAIGLLSGLTGVGGGIFLSPLLIFAGWGEPRAVAAVSAPFVLVNSLAGLGGHLVRGLEMPAALPIWALAAVAGGLLGSGMGARRLGAPGLRRLLAVVLAVAGVKMLLLDP
jgi:uncharacterized membrane protein YfcA